MFVAHVRQRTNHPTKFFADPRDKRAVKRIGQDQFQTRPHLVACCFVAELAHERGKFWCIAQFGIANPESVFL